MKTKEVTVSDPRIDWLQALCACEQQVINMADMLMQLIKSTGNDGYSGGLYQEVDTLHLRLKQLMQEVETEDGLVVDRQPMQLTIGEVVALNRMRDRVRKMEQAVFLLRYRVNQFFSNRHAA